jgi:flavin-dependent dehydrogenase/NAD-dependent dihydropyrimidine dehydrogenase PreA subunit
MKIILDAQRCTGCGVCVRVCPQKILALVGDTMQVQDPDRCMGCFGCEDECPESAVRVLRAPPGTAQIPIEPPPSGIARCDVAVVGAGPAGIGAAIACARAGLDVVVLDRLPNRRISHHVDGGVLFTLPWITSMAVSEEAVAFPDLEISIQARFARPCGAMGILGPDGLQTENHFPPGVEGWAGHKDRFVEALVNEAEAAGARFWFNAKVADVLREDDRIAGVVLDGGRSIRSRVVVTADGAFAKISEKAGMAISHDDLWVASVLAFEYENAAGLPGGLYYLNGDMPWGDELPGAFGGLAITDVIHVMVACLSRRRTYPAPRPLDAYVEMLLHADPRLSAILGDALEGATPHMLTGCRAVFRARCNTDTVGAGVISVGDAWVDDGELGNVPALAHGVYAGRVIAQAARQNDFSKAALNPANQFLEPRLLRALAENKRMKLLSATLDEEELRRMFRFMQHMNYPVMMFGNPRQQAVMFTWFFLKNLGRFLRYPKLARKLF